jgi:hypothetical protein
VSVFRRNRCYSQNWQNLSCDQIVQHTTNACHVSVPVYKPHCMTCMLQAGHSQPSSPVARTRAAIATRGHAALQSKVDGHIYLYSVYCFLVNAAQVDACSELFAIQSDTALWNKAKHTMLCSCLSIELQLRAILPSGLCMQMRLWGSQFTSQDTL